MASISTSASRPRPVRPSTSARSAASASRPFPTGSTRTPRLPGAPGARGGPSRRSRAPAGARRPTARGEWEVGTDQGTVTAEIVVDAGGIWGREIGELAGVELPIVPMEHQYLVTDAIQAPAAPHPQLPVIRDVEASFYVREEAGGLIVGPYEAHPKPWSAHGIPAAFGLQLVALGA